MWVSRVAKWPPARVAIQPPRVAYSKDCGKWRRVRPCSRSCSSSRGPVAPAWIRAASEARVDLEHPVEPAQVHRHHRPLAEPRLDPADDAGAAAERDHRGALGLGPAQHRLDLRLVAREGDQVRRVLELARGSRGRRRGRPCPARARRARSARRRRGPRTASGALQPRLAQLDLLQRHRLLDLAAEPEPRPDPFRRLAHLRAPSAPGPRYPHPQCFSLRSRPSWRSYRCRAGLEGPSRAILRGRRSPASSRVRSPASRPLRTRPTPSTRSRLSTEAAAKGASAAAPLAQPPGERYPRRAGDLSVARISDCSRAVE